MDVKQEEEPLKHDKAGTTEEAAKMHDIVNAGPKPVSVRTCHKLQGDDTRQHTSTHTNNKALGMFSEAESLEGVKNCQDISQMDPQRHHGRTVTASFEEKTCGQDIEQSGQLQQHQDTCARNEDVMSYKSSIHCDTQTHRELNEVCPDINSLIVSDYIHDVGQNERLQLDSQQTDNKPHNLFPDLKSLVASTNDLVNSQNGQPGQQDSRYNRYIYI